MTMARPYDETIQDAVYHELKKGIMGLHMPPGMAMSTQEMATRLNVSRTPVREAFLRLQQEGLVDTIPQKETVVSRIDLKRVEQERFIRESLELAIIEPFLRNRTPEVLARLKESIDLQMTLYRQRDFARFIRSDDQFHKILFDTAEQPLAWETLMNTNGHYNRIRVLTVQNEITGISSIRQHEKLLELLQHDDADAIRAELADHVRKLNIEKTELQALYPDYFSTGQDLPRIRIAAL